MAQCPRVIIATPSGVERTMLAEWLAAAGFEPVRALSVQNAVLAIEAGAFDVLVADAEFAFRHGLDAIRRAGRRPESTLIIGPADRVTEKRAHAVGAVFMTRPVDRASFVCLVSMILVEDRPVRRSPRKSVHSLEAVVEGAPSSVVDLSPEGLRLEVPSDCGGLSVPFFRVRLPMFGTVLQVRRVWTRMRPGAAPAGFAHCGAALAQNTPQVQRAWHALVDALPEVTRPAPPPRPPVP